MTSEAMPLGIVVERRETDHPWETHIWTPVAVAPGAPENPQWKEVARGDG
ncbi:MAG: DUF3305 domain-containing protein, partial [Rhodospirillaceae bacterium]|nr:DUF3305 domain-containing protein [Rhodospirillaceae bacterium]